MSKLSKHQRKLKKQKQIALKKAIRGAPMLARTPCNEPLNGQMVIRKITTYVPEVIATEIITPASGNGEQKKISQIVFKPHAVKALKNIIAWGDSTDFNRTEQQGILLGQVYQTPSGYTGVVEEVILSAAVGNQVFVESEHSQWFAMEQEMDKLNANRKKKLIRVGWWHTHPNMNVFMSSTDKNTQSLYFHKDWQFAVVLNPQNERMAAFIGENADPCSCYFINTHFEKIK